MASDINPLNRQSSYTGNVPGNDAVSFNTRGGNGRGGGRGNQDAEEEDADAPDEGDPAHPQLTSDAFFGTRASASIAQLFDDELPWEQDAARAPGPPGALDPAARPRTGTGRLNDPQGVSLDRIKIPEPPGSRPAKTIRPVLPNAQARRVDANFDSAGAVNQTWRAQQELIEQRKQQASETAKPSPESSEIGRLLRPPSGTAPLRPPIPPPRSGTAKLQIPAPLPTTTESAVPPQSASSEVPGQPATPRPAPERQPAPPVPAPPHRANPETPPPAAARPPQPMNLPPPEDVSQALETLQPLPEAEPPVPEAASVSPSTSQGLNGSCLYRVVDIATDLPLVWAQVELEPVRDSTLPQFNGQTDDDGWFRQTGVPPGEYRITVRARGYVPIYKVRIIEAGLTDDLALFTSKP